MSRKPQKHRLLRTPNPTTPKPAQKILTQPTDKAYKLLAHALDCSHKQAKSLIDKGLVLANGARLHIARAEIALNTRFEVLTPPKPQILFENHELLALEKPPFIESYALCEQYEGWSLLHRLDYETSGVILLVREGSEFHTRAKAAFRDGTVYKEYMCVVHGIVPERVVVEKPISTSKGSFARSRIDGQGKSAHTELTPLRIEGKRTLLRAVIKTGRTHQIRVHCQSIEHPIVGDRIYGKSDNAKRLQLHAHKIALLGYEIESAKGLDFKA